MTHVINFDSRAKRYSLSPFGTGTVIHCDPCAETGVDGHWTAVRGLSDALAWVEYHEIHHAHRDDAGATPIADSIVPPHEHPEPEQLYAVVTGHARDNAVWTFNDRHAARIVGRLHSGAVVGLPILDDYRAGAPEPADDPLARVEQHREQRGPCSATHPTRGLCVGYSGHFPPVHMSRYGEEWTDTDTGAEPNTGRQGDDLAEMFGQMLADALGMPVSMVEIERLEPTVPPRGGESPFGPDIETPPADEMSPVDDGDDEHPVDTEQRPETDELPVDVAAHEQIVGQRPAPAPADA